MKHSFIAISLFLFGLSVCWAEIVDTWQFSSDENRVRAVTLAKELRCPQCQNQNLVESTSPIAHDLRLEVYQMVEDGHNNQQIITIMTERFGDFVLYKPPLNSKTQVLWLGPFIFLLLACLFSMGYLRRCKSKAKLNQQQQQQLQQLLDAHGASNVLASEKSLKVKPSETQKQDNS